MADENEVEESLLSDLGAAWDDDDSTTEGVEASAATEEPAVTEDAVAESADTTDALGEGGSNERASADGAEEGGEAEAGDAGGEVAAAETNGPPVGLSPEAREVWKDTPKAVQEALVQREKQFATGIQKYAEAAKRAEGMDRALQPYQQYLAMNGGPEHIGALLQTGAGLQMGSPVQKAQTVAKLIKDFGVDISTLDSLLVGDAPPAQAQQQNDTQMAIQQAMAPYQQFMQQQQQQQQMAQQQQGQQVQSEVQAFATNPANEFYNDVKMDMADLMDMAANRGQNMPMEEAYKRACQMNTGISNILQSRTSANDIAGKVAAAASISGSPGGPGGGKNNPSLGDSIRDAWDNAGRA